MEINIWNPESHEDYVLDAFDSGERFSSLARNLYAVEVTGATDNTSYSALVTALLDSASVLTVVIVPWLKKKVFEPVLDKIVDMNYSSSNFSGVVSKHDVVGSHLLSARSELGGNDSGEWIFIGTQKVLPLSSSEIDNGFSSILKCDFDFVIYMAEMQQTFILFKGTEELLAVVELLREDKAAAL